MDLLDPLHAVCSTDRNPSVINDNFLEFLIVVPSMLPVYKKILEFR